MFYLVFGPLYPGATKSHMVHGGKQWGLWQLLEAIGYEIYNCD